MLQPVLHFQLYCSPSYSLCCSLTDSVSQLDYNLQYSLLQLCSNLCCSLRDSLCYHSVTVVLRLCYVCYHFVTAVLQLCYGCVTTLLQLCYSCVTAAQRCEGVQSNVDTLDFLFAGLQCWFGESSHGKQRSSNDAADGWN